MSMVLSDKTIKEEIKAKKIVIVPYDKELVQPSSYNLRLANSFRIFKNTKQAFLDVHKPVDGFMEMIKCVGDEPIIIHPHEFVLGETEEYFEFPDNIVGRLEGKSSLARLGIIIHTTAGFFDPGFKGTATLEISNMANIPIALYPGMKIGQMSFYYLTTPAENPYGSRQLGSKYQGQKGPTESRVFKEFIKKKR